MEFDRELCREIARILRTPGAVVLLPTETVYGLVCRAADETARCRIFKLKRRPDSKMLGWFVSGTKMLKTHGVKLNPLALKLISHYTPGALTIISETADGTTQGYRIPDHPLINGILAELDEPLAQTSANSSGMPDAVNCQEALAQLDGEVDYYVDHGALPENAVSSTVVDTSSGSLKILRRGAIDIERFSDKDL